jgi:hypothetical protein
MIVEPPGRRREVHVRERPTAQDWAEEVAHIVEVIYPTAQKITLIQDNLSAHKKAALYECFAPERARVILSKLEFVFTPKRGSWLNVAEIELRVLTQQGLPRVSLHKRNCAPVLQHGMSSAIRERLL